MTPTLDHQTPIRSLHLALLWVHLITPYKTQPNQTNIPDLPNPKHEAVRKRSPWASIPPSPRSLGGPSKWVPRLLPLLLLFPLSPSLPLSSSPGPTWWSSSPLTHQQSGPVQKDSFKLAPSPPASQLRFRPRSSPLRIPTPLPPLVPPALLRICIAYVLCTVCTVVALGDRMYLTTRGVG